MQKFSLFFLCTLLSAPKVTAGQDGCRSFERTIDGRKQVVLENRYVRLLFEPENGGKLISFQNKSAGVELVRSNLGMLIDRFWQVPRKVNPWNGAYEHDFKVRSPGEMALRLTKTATGKWKYHALEKTITLTRGSSVVLVNYAYRVHENRMSPSIISPWVSNGCSAIGELNKLFLPLANGVYELEYNPAGPPFHEKFFYNPARSWMAAAGQRSGAGLAMTFDVSRVMAFYFWFGNNRNTMEWMYHSVKVRHGEALELSHELVPFVGLKKVAGAGGGLVAELEVTPEVPEAGRDLDFGLNLYSGLAGPVRLVLTCELLPGRRPELSISHDFQFTANATRSLSFHWKPRKEGTYAVRGIAFRGELPVCDFELPVRIGKTAVAYSLPRLKKMVGDPKEQFGVAGATLEKKAIPAIKFTEEIKTPHVKWARPYYRGPLKVMILTDQMQGREITELQQRMELQVTVPLAIANHRFDVGDLYGKYTPEMCRADLTEKLEGKYDVIVVGGANKLWTAEHRKMLASLVKKGTGLVWVGAKTPEELKGLLPLNAEKAFRTKLRWNPPKVKDHPVTRLLPFSLLPATDVALGRVSEVGTLLAAAAFFETEIPLIAVNDGPGHGRILQMNYSTSWSGFEGAFCGITPFDRYPVREPYPYWEYWYSLLARAILWAGRFEAPVHPVVAPPVYAPAKGQLSTVSFTVQLQGDVSHFQNLQIELTLKGKYAKELYHAARAWAGSPVTFSCGPVLGAGRHFADIHVLAENKVVNWGTYGFSVSGGTAIDKLQLSRPKLEDVFIDGDTVEARARVRNPVAGGEVVAELFDGYGRLLARKQEPIAPKLAVALPVVRSLHPGGLLQVKLVQRGEVLDLERRFVTVLPESFASQKRDDFTGILWGTLGAYQRSWIAREKARIIRKLGFHSVLGSPHWFPIDFVWPTRLGLRPLAISVVRTGHDRRADAKVQETYRNTGDKKVLVRTPSLSDPVYKAKALAEARKAVERLHAVRPLAYNFGDEVSYAPRGLDYDFSPHALAELRQWLQTEYRSLEELNREWEADFKTWDEVEPFTSREAVESGKYARWADLRLFASQSVADFHQALIDEMRKVDPKARYGLSGTQVPYAYNGMDWARLNTVFNYHNNYWGGGELLHLHSDLSPGIRLAEWIGYGRTGPEVRKAIWATYLHGQAGISFYDLFSLLNPDLRPSRSALDISEATRDLRRGLGKLLLHSQWQKDRVAVYYSMPSILGANITGREHRFERYGWLWALMDCGFMPRYVSYLDVRKNGLSNRKFDLLVLPMAMALSEKETQAFRAFVKNGGTVLADSIPGILSGHCRKLANGSLDVVFGIHHQHAEIPVRAAGTLKVRGEAQGLSLGDWEEGTELATKRITLDGGEALGHMGAAPAIVVHPFGKGRACYLNLLMSKYVALRKANKESAMRERMRKLFQWAGAKPAIQVTRPDGSPIAKLQVFLYRARRSLFAGFVLDQDQPQEVRIRFPRRGHLYDMRKGQYLSKGGLFRVTLLPKDGLVLALLPYRVQGLKVEAGSAEPGGTCRVTIATVTDSTPGLHVFRLEVIGPDGHRRKCLGQNVLAKSGRSRASVPFALNDPPGEYHFVAQDVISGLRSTVSVILPQQPDGRFE